MVLFERGMIKYNMGLVQNKGKETRKVSLTKETKQIFWMQDLMELKGMHPSNPVCTCNLGSVKCFEDSANPPSGSAGKVWADLGVSSLLLVASPHLFSLREKDWW